ncbi:DUF7261 family protein [Halomicrobium salinisoli]|uniref:DUF7261 family protein n=1 Tax=Halomicrobium salinisoli TaxID=2878391 RepID=UPI001CF0513F|nr:hypothetical protein [Halomicrobium salinisoli]
MADLNGDRGQILLVAALALAAVFVLLTVVVNSAIFTENLASRGETVGSDEALTLRAAVTDGVGETITYANRHNDTSNDALARNVTAETENVSAAVSRHYVVDGAAVDVSGPHEFANGTRIVDENAGGSTFVGADDDAANWTVAEGVAARAVVLNVSRDSVMDDPEDESEPAESGFYVEVDDGSNAWNASLVREPHGGSDEFTVAVRGPSDSDDGYCTVDGSPEHVPVDLTEGTVAGEPCAPLDFARNVSEPYDVSYHNGDKVNGNYSLVVDEDDAEDGNDNLTAAGTGDPDAHDAIYSVTVRYRYDGPQLHYETNVRVAPGESR